MSASYVTGFSRQEWALLLIYGVLIEMISGIWQPNSYPAAISEASREMGRINNVLGVLVTIIRGPEFHNAYCYWFKQF